MLIGSDHAGFELKSILYDYLFASIRTIRDIGTSNKVAVDYPDIAVKLCTEVLETSDLGILVCGSGIGMAITANKISGIRAAVISDPLSAKLARLHNDANVICLGSRIIGSTLAMDIVDNFINTKFEGGRHATRVNKIIALEK